MNVQPHLQMEPFQRIDMHYPLPYRLALEPFPDHQHERSEDDGDQRCLPSGRSTTSADGARQSATMHSAFGSWVA